MRKWRVGTISMGLLLIILGIIMLVGQIYKVSVVEQIIKWWPIILVVLGIETLGYTFFFGKEEAKVKFDVFSILIITLIMIFSMGVYIVTSVLNNNVLSSTILERFDFYKYETSYLKNMSIDSKGINKLVLNNNSGNVQIEKGEENEIQIEANITIQNNDEKYVKEVADSLIDITKGDIFKIKSKAKQFLDNKSKIKNININYLVKVPEKISVEVENQFGDVITDNISNEIIINNKNGDVIAKSIRGNIEINNSYGQITLKNINGDIKTNNKYGDIYLVNINGKTNIKNSNGKINFESDKLIDKDVSLHSELGSIALKLPKEQQGEFKAYTENGQITNSINLTVKTEQGINTIDESIGKGDIKFNLRNQNGNIEIQTN